MYQKRVTLPDTGSLILKHFEMTDLHVQSALHENFLDFLDLLGAMQKSAN